MTTAVTLHDLNLAAAFCDRLVVLSRGAVVAAGPPVEVLTPALTERVWNVRADVDVVRSRRDPLPAPVTGGGGRDAIGIPYSTC